MRSRIYLQLAAIAVSASSAVCLTGCGALPDPLKSSQPVSPSAARLSGAVHGGQQPVSGAIIGMYAAGNSGYGSPAVSVLNAGVTITSSADGYGSFSLTGKYTCTPDQRIFLTATGGNSGSGTNPAIAMMAALGRCGDLTPATYVVVNEVTTAAAVTALAPFMSGPAGIGAPASNQIGLNNAFDDIKLLVNSSTGYSPGMGLPSGTTVAVPTIYALADILAACINTASGSSGPCTSLFQASSRADPNDPNGAHSGDPLPTDTLTAMLDIASHPSRNASALGALIGPNAPFQPAMTSFPDFTVAVTFSANLIQPVSLALDAAGSAWIVDGYANSVTVLAHDGTQQFTQTSLRRPTSVAIDQNGSGWITNSGDSSLTRIAPGSFPSTFTGGGLSIPMILAIDGQGNVWVANYGNNSTSEFSGAGVPLSPPAGFPVPVGPPIFIGLNPH